MSKISKIVRKVENYTVIILLLGMVFTCFGQVVFRLVLNKPLAWSEELARYLFVWLTFIGGVIAVSEASHFKMDFLATFLHQKGKSIILIIVSISIIIFSAILVVYGIPLVRMVFSQKSPALKVSMSYVYMALPINGLLAIFHSIEIILKEIINLKSTKEVTN